MDKADKIKWCLEKNEGLELVEPNSGLADGYIRKAEAALETNGLARDRDWKISTAYYSLYFSVYAVLIRVGIKCEIHSCTIEFAKRFLREFFSRREIQLFEDSLEARKDAQYYVNRNVSDETYQRMIGGASDMIAKCKDILAKIDDKKVNEIRSALKAVM